MAVLGLHFCARAFSSCGKWRPLFIAVRGWPLFLINTFSKDDFILSQDFSYHLYGCDSTNQPNFIFRLDLCCTQTCVFICRLDVFTSTQAPWANIRLIVFSDFQNWLLILCFLFLLMASIPSPTPSSHLNQPPRSFFQISLILLHCDIQSVTASFESASAKTFMTFPSIRHDLSAHVLIPTPIRPLGHMFFYSLL